MEKIPLLLFLYLALCSDLPAQERRSDNSTDIHFTVPITTDSRGKSIWEDKSGEAAGNFDQAVLKLPCNYSKRGKPTRLIYVAHGAGGGVTADSWFLNNFALVDTLLANGYAIYDVNGGSVENMGGYCELFEINSEDHGLSCGNPLINHELVLFLKRSNKFRHDGK
jgi:hypothetical protein